MVQFKGYQNPNKSILFLFPTTILFQTRDVNRNSSQHQIELTEVPTGLCPHGLLLRCRNCFLPLLPYRSVSLWGSVELSAPFADAKLRVVPGQALHSH